MKFWDEASRNPNCPVCHNTLLDPAGKGIHPLCDRSREVWWTPEEMLGWLAEQEAIETGPESHADERTPPAASEETQKRE